MEGDVDNKILALVATRGRLGLRNYVGGTAQPSLDLRVRHLRANMIQLKDDYDAQLLMLLGSRPDFINRQSPFLDRRYTLLR